MVRTCHDITVGKCVKPVNVYENPEVINTKQYFWVQIEHATVYSSVYNSSFKVSHYFSGCVFRLQPKLVKLVVAVKCSVIFITASMHCLPPSS